MLVLSRKQQQEIVIGENVKVTVLKIKGNTVRLGIEAPQEVRVVRGELPRKSAPSAVTVVFHDPVDDRPADIVPFQKPKSNSNEQRPRASVMPADLESQVTLTKVGAPGKPRTKASAEPPRSRVTPSAAFQHSLPSNQQENRLQEIVREISGK